MEVISACQRECEIQIKTLNSIASFYGIASKNERTMKGLERMNIMDDQIAIDMGLGDPEVDKVKCPEHDDLITREECLDFSGHNHEICGGCEIGQKTKRTLLPETT
jgi:hypothetical protein